MVGGEYARTTTVGNDRDTFATRFDMGRKRLRCGHELTDRRHADCARATDRGLENVIRAYQRAAMRNRGAHAGRMPARFHDDDRLRACGGPQRADEAARIANTFDVE